ncbi:6740_t:CDS:2 [Acaulospora colombiana]|uniref:6740_t:CDS:1 n=1 Tax=Acaulospora colombiana TaxID=27376 RepID=A0ACA9N5Y1_9GLOM|nr:6740_t:CDS:2 [Acaulospora colombiana]
MEWNEPWRPESDLKLVTIDTHSHEEKPNEPPGMPLRYSVIPERIEGPRPVSGMVSIPVTTLSLFLKFPGSLQISLYIPTLANLFLSIPVYDPQDWLWGDPSNFRWKLPALHNLAIIERYDRRPGPPSIALPSTHSFFLNLLTGHFSSIRSLLIHPMTLQVSSQHSSLCWKKMPKLQTLATNFSDRDVPSHRKHFFNKQTQDIESKSVRHLIQFHLWAAGSTSMASELQSHIHACTNLESVTMVNAPGFDTRNWVTMRPEKEIVQLIKLCDRRNIDLWEQDRLCTLRKLTVQDSKRESDTVIFRNRQLPNSPIRQVRSPQFHFSNLNG